MRAPWLVFAAGILLAGCTPLSVQRFDTEFDGLNAAVVRAAANDGTLRVLVVHGMGRHHPDENKELIAGIATRLHLTIDQKKPPISIDYQTHHFGQIDVSDYAGDNQRRIRFYELTWSPTTDKLKDKFFATDLDSTHVSERVAVNRDLKHNLVDDSLSDPALYTGRFRKHMQYPIMRAVVVMLDDFQLHDEVAIITKSLGSYMTYDTLRAMSDGRKILDEQATEADRVRQLIARTNYIYMLANQLPLLELSEVDNPLSEKKPAEGLKEFARIRAAAPRSRPATAPLKLHLVAFNDPNDLLTFPLDQSDVTSDIVFSNVTISVERSAVLGVFAWPTTAHTGHDKSKRVMDLLAFGHHAR